MGDCVISPIEIMVDRACGVSEDKRKHRWPVLRCPKCKKSKRVSAGDTDPNTTAIVEFPCLECGSDGWECPRYFDESGAEIYL